MYTHLWDFVYSLASKNACEALCKAALQTWQNFRM